WSPAGSRPPWLSQRHLPALDHRQAAVLDPDLTTGQAGLQPVDVELDVDGDRVAGREVLGLHLGAAARAVELEDPHPVGVGRERERPLDQRRMDLPGVAFVDETPLLVGPAGRDELGVAAVAAPRLTVEV